MKFSFESVEHELKIEEDIWDHTQRYVLDQIAMMKRRGSAPNPPLTEAQFRDLVYVIAKYPQEIRNSLRQENDISTVGRADTV